jgi:hypothetical protein
MRGRKKHSAEKSDWEGLNLFEKVRKAVSGNRDHDSTVESFLTDALVILEREYGGVPESEMEAIEFRKLELWERFAKILWTAAKANDGRAFRIIASILEQRDPVDPVRAFVGNFALELQRRKRNVSMPSLRNMTKLYNDAVANGGKLRRTNERTMDRIYKDLGLTPPPRTRSGKRKPIEIRE